MIGTPIGVSREVIDHHAARHRRACQAIGPVLVLPCPCEAVAAIVCPCGEPIFLRFGQTWCEHAAHLVPRP